MSESPYGLLEPFEEGIWTCRQPFRFFGFQIGARMTVIDLTGQGDLFVHSPIKLGEKLKQDLEALGSVRHVAAPNCWHHLFVGDYKAQNPDARFYCSPGLDIKRPDIEFDEVLEEGKAYPWSSELAHHVVGGCPTLNEVVFFHATTRTLVVTDIGLHICEESPLTTRMLFRVMGNYGRFGWARIEKKALIKDRALFQQSISKILEWDFERIVLSHGRLVREDGRSAFQKAFREH